MIQLRLSAADIARHRRCMRALLSPLQYGDVDEWRAEVNHALKPLLGSDMATFMLPLDGVEPLYCEEVDVYLLRTYMRQLGSIDPGSAVLDRTVKLKVTNRDMVWGERLPAYRRSAYYNEFIVPVRAFDMLCAATRTRGSAHPASLYFHHQSRRGTRFGMRGLQILRTLYPAFEAGVQTFERLHARREGLLRALDNLAEALCVYDFDANLMHRSATLNQLLLDEPGAPQVMACAQELARHLTLLVSERSVRGRSSGAGGARTVWIDQRRFELRGSFLERGGAGPSPAVLISVREADRLPVGTGEPHVVDGAELARRFGLTAREADVAHMLRDRRTNAEIARRLGISEHTARHHTERVLAKLAVRSRRQVAARLAAAISERQGAN